MGYCMSQDGDKVRRRGLPTGASTRIGGTNVEHDALKSGRGRIVCFSTPLEDRRSVIHNHRANDTLRMFVTDGMREVS